MKFLGERRIREVRRKLHRHEHSLSSLDRLDPEKITALQDELEYLETAKERYFEMFHDKKRGQSEPTDF